MEGMEDVEAAPLLRYVTVGTLTQNTIILPNGEALINQPGGSALFAAIGAKVWQPDVGFVARVGNQFPAAWLERFDQTGLLSSGICRVDDVLDTRFFVDYSDPDGIQLENPVFCFARQGLVLPPELLDYPPLNKELDNRIRMGKIAPRTSEIAGYFLDATAFHIAPLEYLAHTMLPAKFRERHDSTVTMEASAGYMDPSFYDLIPALVRGLAAFHTTEARLRSLFRNRTNDLWEMVEAISAFGCPVVTVRLSEGGYRLWDSDSRTRWEVPQYPVVLVNPVGGGDAFCGGFLVGIRETYDPLEAMLYGDISASMVMEGKDPFYALDSMPGLAEARLFSLRGMVRRG